MNRESLEALETAGWRRARDCADKNCVEVAAADGAIGVRDTKDRGRGPVLAFSQAGWKTFLNRAKNSQFS